MGDRILAATFTRKAAGEILDRIILRLAVAAQDEEGAAELAQFVGDASLDQRQCQVLLASVVRQLHRLQISTLDSFFVQMARTFAFELDLPAGWEIVDDLADDRLRSQAVDAVLMKGDLSRLRTLMNLLSKGAAARSVSQMIRDTVKQCYGLFQETDKAAWNRLKRPKPIVEAELTRTLDELRELATDDSAMAKGRDEDCERAARGDWEAFVNTGIAVKLAAGERDYRRKPIPEDFIPVYQRLLAYARSELLGLVAMQNEATHELLELYDAEYGRLKQAQRALRFSDITLRLSEFSDVREASQLALRMDSGIDHLLLDEFQDTSPLQWQVLRPLAERVTRGQGTSFFCVGDVKQAIYAWRGGVAEIFDAIGSQLSGLETEHLNTSYRSSPVIIETVNRIFQKSMASHANLEQASRAVERWVDRFEPHASEKAGLAGYAEIVAAPKAKKATDQKEANLLFAAKKVAEIARQARGRSIGVLTRKNETVGRLAYYLRRHGVPVSEEGGSPLVDSAAVNTIISLLRLADHPGDTAARFHVSHSSLGLSLAFEDFRDDEGARRTAAWVRRQLSESGYGETIAKWAGLLSTDCSPREWSRVNQLVEMAYSYEENATLRTDDFVRWVKETKVSDPLAADVRVMTIHQAKGLEFDIVVLPELDADIIGSPGGFVVERPDATAPPTCVCRYAGQGTQRLMPQAFREMFDHAVDHDVTESLCLLYVAVTRAVHALHMIVSPSSVKKSGKPGKTPRTFDGLLLTSLADKSFAEPESICFSLGDPHWYKAEDETSHSAASQADAAVEPVTVSLAPVDAERIRGWERVSPSSLEGGERSGVVDVFAKQDEAARLRGLLVHAWMELVTWLEDGRPGEDELRDVANELLTGVHHNLDISRELVEFGALLDSPAIGGLLSRKRYSRLGKLGFSRKTLRGLAKRDLSISIDVERRIAVRVGNQLVNGVLDRLVALEEDDRPALVEIIDYKTDQIAAGDDRTLQTRMSYYEPQLKAYRRAVSQMTGLAPARILTALVFTTPRIVLPLAGGEQSKQLTLW